MEGGASRKVGIEVRPGQRPHLGKLAGPRLEVTCETHWVAEQPQEGARGARTRPSFFYVFWGVLGDSRNYHGVTRPDCRSTRPNGVMNDWFNGAAAPSPSGSRETAGAPRPQLRLRWGSHHDEEYVVWDESTRSRS